MKKKQASDRRRMTARIIRRAQRLVRRFNPSDDIDLTDEVLEDRKRDSALVAAQDYFCKLAPPERIFSEELFEERRDEAASD